MKKEKIVAVNDTFGIGTALRAIINNYFIQSRNTGRTLSMIQSYKKGDRIIFHTSDHARHAERIARDLGIELEYSVITPSEVQKVFRRDGSKGRIIFDHVWLEIYYQNAFERAFKNISDITIEASGYGMRHIETKRQAEEIMKFGSLINSSNYGEHNA